MAEKSRSKGGCIRDGDGLGAPESAFELVAQDVKVILICVSFHSSSIQDGVSTASEKLAGQAMLAAKCCVDVELSKHKLWRLRYQIRKYLAWGAVRACKDCDGAAALVGRTRGWC